MEDIELRQKMAISGKRLEMEWRNWNTKDHPSGIQAQPVRNPNGTLNLRTWECIIPGPKSSPWEPGRYKMIMTFSYDFPVIPPICRFDPPVFHPNVSLSGEASLPELSENILWSSNFNIEMILWHIQDMLEHPNILVAANLEAKQMYLRNVKMYERLVRKKALKMGAVGE